MKKLIMLTTCMLLLVGCGSSVKTTVTNKVFEKEDIITTTIAEVETTVVESEATVAAVVETTAAAAPDFSMTTEEIATKFYEMHKLQFENYDDDLDYWLNTVKGKEQLFVGAYWNWIKSAFDGDWVYEGDIATVGVMEIVGSTGNTTDYADAIERCRGYYLDYTRAMTANPNTLVEHEEECKNDVAAYFARLEESDKKKVAESIAVEESLAEKERLTGISNDTVIWENFTYVEREDFAEIIGFSMYYPSGITPVEVQLGKNGRDQKFLRMLGRYKDDSGKFMFLEAKWVGLQWDQDTEAITTHYSTIADCEEFYTR